LQQLATDYFCPAHLDLKHVPAKSATLSYEF